MKYIYLVLLSALLAPPLMAAEADEPVESLLRLPGFGLYVGAGFGRIAVDEDDIFNKEVDYTAGEVLAGIYWRWLGIEARSGQSLEDETIKVGEEPDTLAPIFTKTALESYSSYYLRIQRSWDVARIYGLVGVSDITATSTFNDGTIERVSVSGTSYGLGAGFNINPNMAFNFEMKYLINDDEQTYLMSGFNVDLRF